jgi:hypothetical protein
MKNYKLKQRNLRASHTLGIRVYYESIKREHWVGLGTGTPEVKSLIIFFFLVGYD